LFGLDTLIGIDGLDTLIGIDETARVESGSKRGTHMRGLTSARPLREVLAKFRLQLVRWKVLAAATQGRTLVHFPA
jgi:hypothetical protein